MIRLFQFVVLLLGLALVALISAIATMRFAIHGAEVKVPSFQGLTAQEALDKAAGLGVEMTVDNRFYSAEVPAGRILSQSPAPGTVVRREWHVRATESLGPQLVAIPNLVGMQQRAATMQIRRLGLEAGAVAHMPSPAAQAGTVIAQDPPAGAAGVERPSIAVVVSDGPVDGASAAAYAMPNFLGQPYATVAAAIARTGLRLGQVSYVAVEAVAKPVGESVPGTVKSQSPPAGYSVDAGTPVELTVVR